MRMPTSGRPAVTTSGTAAERGRSRVNGPGQKAFIRPRTAGAIFRHEMIQHRILMDWAGDVHNDRIPRGALFGCENAGDGVGIESIGAEAVDGFGGQGDQAAGTKDLCRLSDCSLRLVGVDASWVDDKAQGLHSLYCRRLKPVPR